MEELYEFDTRAVREGQDPSSQTEKCSKPSTIYSTHGTEEKMGDSGIRQQLERCIASLEGAKYGLCFPSGLGAITTVIQLLQNGDHAVVFDSVYAGTKTYLRLRQELGQIEVDYVDFQDSSVLEKYIKKNTKMVYIETPCNPTLKVLDIAAISDIVKKHKGREIFLVADNTFMSPYFQNPLHLGVDIVVHSLTKFMNGFSDVLMGAAVTNDENLYVQLKDLRDNGGVLPSPMDCFLVRRGLKTLHLRMQRHAENAMKIAEFLEGHSNVECVYYPGLKSHPKHELARRQGRGFGGMVSFCIRGGDVEALSFGKKLKVFTLARSLGSTESLADVSCLMTANCLTREERLELGITDNLIRLSVGVESADDLIADLQQALESY